MASQTSIQIASVQSFPTQTAPSNPPAGSALGFYDGTVYQVLNSSGVNILAPSASPTFTGTPAAPTAAVFTNTTQLATTAYVDRNFMAASPAGFREHFISANSNAAITTAVAINFDGAWATAQVVGGTQAVNTLDATFANPGQVAMVTAAVSGQGVSLYKTSGGKAPLGNLAAQAGWEINFIAQLAATTLEAIRIGVCSTGQQVSDPPSNGMYMEYDTANTGNTDTKFTYVTRSASTPTYGNTTGTIAVDTSFHRFRIRSLVAGTILFSVDGGTEYSTALTVSTALMMPFIQIISRTTAAKTLNVDFFSYMASTGGTF